MESEALNRLKRAAAFYLGRYASSSAHLAEVLRRQVRRRARRLGADPALELVEVARAVAFCVDAGLVDDEKFARSRAVVLRQRGWASRRIAMALRAQGLTAAQVAAAVGESDAETELTAARRFAERRRLGPWRLGDRDAKRFKDIAALARAGFSPGLARAVIEAPESDEVPSETLLKQSVKGGI